MDTKKNLDLAAGRLAKVPTRHGTPRPRPKKTSSYGTARLGITPDAEGQEPEAVEVAPARTAPPASSEPVRAKPARPEPVARQPDPAPAAMAVTDSMGRLQALGVGKLFECIRRRWVLAAAIGMVATVGVAWLVFSGGPGSTVLPQTPARAHAAVATAKHQARPAPVSVAPKPIAPEPASPEPVATDDPAPPAHRGTTRGNPRFSARTTALLSGLFKDAREAWPHAQPSPSAPAPPVKPHEPPKPEKAAAPAPPTYDYMPCPPGFRFTGAVQRPGATFANINGRFIRVGGKVGGATVVKINTSSAILEMEGKRFVVCFSMEAPKNDDEDEDEDDKDDEDNQADKPTATTQPAARATLELSLINTQAA